MAADVAAQCVQLQQRIKCAAVIPGIRLRAEMPQADPAVQAQLQAAKAAAQARYEQEKQAQAINHSEEKAQQSRTWAAQK